MTSSTADLQILEPQERLSLEVDESENKSGRETLTESGSNNSFNVLQSVIA